MFALKEENIIERPAFFSAPQYVINACFNRLERNGEVYYWRDCHGDDNGYMVLYSDGNHLHTYHHPENFL